MENTANILTNAIDEFAATLPAEEQEDLGRLLSKLNQSLKVTALSELSENEYLKDLNERALYNDYAARNIVPEKLIKSNITIVLKATRLCNLRCVYCHSWRSGPNQVMKYEKILETMYKTLISCDQNKVDFVWHGGETTLLSREFFEKAIWIQQKFKKPGQQVNNAVQTNGVLVDEEWAKFFKEHNFSVGVSLDGPAEINDQRRLDKRGRPTFHKIKKGIERIQEAKVPHGVLMVLDKEVESYGAKNLLDFLAELKVPVVALLNVIPENTDPSEPVKGMYYSWDEYVKFMAGLYEIWHEGYQDKIRIREFDSLTNKITGRSKESICVFAGKCMGYYLTVEPNGDVSACDKYIDDPDYKFGNLNDYDSLSDLLFSSEKLKKAGDQHKEQLKNTCDCEYYYACKGGCPHDYRLNSRYASGFSGDCCGLAPLLKIMTEKCSTQ